MTPPEATDATRQPPWQRLDSRMIWVDAAQTLLSATPAILAVTVFGVEPGLDTLWPVLLLAVAGVGGAINDALRWVKTRYRITGEYVERRTGLLVRQYRSIRRDRIRSVDITAKLRHRLAGLRLVEIGAGQQAAAGEAALSLDAVSRDMAEALRRDLLGTAGAPADPPGTPAGTPGAAAGAEPVAERVLARLRARWVGYNILNIWVYVAAGGLLWGGAWLAGTFGLDATGFVLGLADWQRLGWVWSTVVALLAVTLLGMVLLAVSFFTEHWNFRLLRVAGEQGTVLRTTQGLFQTRQVDRDERRLRGVTVSEPVLWRWLGVTDTSVITTGLADEGLRPASTILPRGPVRVARSVAGQVLAVDPNPLVVPLQRHPRAALRRRCWWAVLGTAAAVGAAATVAGQVAAMPGWVPLAAVGLLPLALLAAVVSYRALGHARCGDYLVVRSGLVARSTTALQARAVVGWRLRQSVLQRRLGLATVAATTAAGGGCYEAPDLSAAQAVEFADRTVPGLLGPFTEESARE